MFGLAAAREVLGQDLTPDSIDSFVRSTQSPLSILAAARNELMDRWSGDLIEPLGPGEIRPLISGYQLHGSMDRLMDRLWAALLYSHKAAIADPLSDSSAAPSDSDRDRYRAVEILHFLGVVAPLVDARILLLIPDDRLPHVKLDVGRVRERLTGFRAALYEAVTDDDSPEWHLDQDVESYIRSLERVASTRWSVHIEPLWSPDMSPRHAYVVRALLLEGRRKLWGHGLRRATMGRFDSFAMDTLTQVPVADLSDVTVHDIRLIRDEDVFGAWRADLASVIADYERNVGAAVPDAARIATYRLSRRAEEIDRTIVDSPALSALRAGMSTFGIAGSAMLAAFPVLSASGRADGLSVAVGSSLVAAGRRLVFSERHRHGSALASTQREHYMAASTVFDGR